MNLKNAGYKKKGKERKSRKRECNREKMPPAESIFNRKFFEVHSGADSVKKILEFAI